MVKNAPKYAVSNGKTEVITPSDMGFLLKGTETVTVDAKGTYSKFNIDENDVLLLNFLK